MSGRRRRNGKSGGGSETSTESGGRTGASTASGGSQSASKDTGGMFSWANKAGDWVGDRWDSATETVGGWVDDAQEFAGNVRDTASDVWDVMSSTDMDIDLREQSLTLTMDLDEVLDLCPDRLQEQFRFDRANSDNMVTVIADRDSGVVTVRSAKLAMLGLSLDGVDAGATTVSDVEIVLTDQDGQLEIGKGIADMSQYSVQVRVGGADVTDLVLSDDKGGETRMDQASFSDLSLDAGRDEDGVKASLGLGNADVSGLSGNTNADCLSLADVQGSMTEGGERGSLSIGNVTAQNMQSAKGSGSASMDGLRMQISNVGGGMPMLDDKEDALAASVQIQTGEVRDLSVGDTELGYLDFAALDLEGNAQDKSASGSLETLAFGGLSGPAEVDRAQVLGTEFSLANNALDLDVDAVSASGVRTHPKSSKASGGGSGGASEGNAMAVTANVGNLDVADANFGGKASFDRLQAGAIGVATDANGITANAGAVDLQGLEAGKVNLGQANAGGVVFQKDGSDVDVSAAQVDATDFRSGDVGIGSANVSGLDVAAGENGFNASMASATVDDFSTRTVDVGSAAVTNGRVQGYGKKQGVDVAVDAVSAADVEVRGKDGSVDVAASTAEIGATNVKARPDGVTLDSESVAVTGLQTDKVSAGSASVTDIGLQTTKGAGGRLDVGNVSATDLDAGALTANSASIDEVGVDFAKGQSAQIEADRASIQGWSANGSVSGERASVDGIALTAGKEGLDATVDSGSARGITGAASAGTVDFAGLDVETQTATGALDARLAELTATDVAAGPGSAQRIALQNVIARRDASGASGSVGSVSATNLGVEGQGTVSQLDATGLAGAKSGETVSGGAESLSATGIELDRGVSVGSLDVQNASGSKGPNGGSVSVGSVDASSVSASLPGKSGKAGGPGGSGGGGGNSGLDAASLVRSGSALVDDVDIRANIPMNEQTLGKGFFSADIEADTEVAARLAIENGEITSDTRADLSNPIDAPLWLQGNGAYVTDNGKLKGDIGGFFDVNVAGKVNSGLGVDGKRLASVAEYGSAAADKMNAPSTGPSGSAGPSGPGLVDMAGATGSGSLSLNSGTLDAGAASVQLDSRRAGSNELVFDAGRDQVEAKIQRLDLAVIAIATGNVDGSVQNVDLDQAKVLLDRNGGDSELTLERLRIDAVELNFTGQ